MAVLVAGLIGIGGLAASCREPAPAAWIRADLRGIVDLARLGPGRGVEVWRGAGGLSLTLKDAAAAVAPSRQ